MTPTTTKALLDAGFMVNVEKSPERTFDDEEFEKVGATLVPEGSWVEAPHDHIIIGLKELPEDDCTWKSLSLPVAKMQFCYLQFQSFLNCHYLARSC